MAKKARFKQVGVTAAALILLGLGSTVPAAGQADPNAPLVKDLLGNTDNLGLDWARLFDVDGRPKDEVDAAGSPVPNGVPDYIDWYGGFDGLAIEDKISAGTGLDMSVLAGGPALSECSVDNGEVGLASDLGNSYVYATFDSLNNPVLYLGLERVFTSDSSSIEIEFNQEIVRVTSGAPWPMEGERTQNDLLLRMNFTLGVVSSVEVSRWIGGSFQPVVIYGGLEAAPCNGEPTVCLFCGGVPPIAAPQEVWDAFGNPVEATPPDDFLEIGVSIGNLLGGFVEYTSIQVRTIEDLSLGAFGAMGLWSGS